MSVTSYAAMRPKAKLVSFTYARKRLRPWNVRIKVTHCGICHSDVHLIDNDWGISDYPLVPGHEVVGEILEMGKSVARLTKGMRVGVGWQAGSCMNCEWCKRGNENLCLASKATCLRNYGGYGQEIQVDSRFAFPIPRSLSSEGAAPLLCGGATVFSPLHRFQIRRGTKVGIIGVGGLGHIAVQFAHAMGAEVTAFSSSPGKEQEAKKFGARHFVTNTDSKQMEKRRQSLDFILSTINANFDVETYLNILKPRGIFCIVGVYPGKLELPAFPLIVEERSIVGSVIGSRSTIKTMLAFAARHGIEARTECMRLSEVNEALDKVRKNKARYRMVLTV